MIEYLKNVMVNAGAGWIIWVLAALSVISLGIALERAWFLWRRKGDVAALTRDLHLRLLQRDYAGADALLRSSASVEATVVAAGLAQWEHGPSAVVEAMSAAKGMERAQLERRLGFLGTVGNNAPFIGLLGTVIGIVGAFEALGQKTAATAAAALAPERVMSTIAEALVTTAVGLVVAIPAVAIFNYFQNSVTVIMESADTLGHILLSHLEGSTGLARSSVRRATTKPAANDTGGLTWAAGDTV